MWAKPTPTRGPPPSGTGPPRTDNPTLVYGKTPLEGVSRERPALVVGLCVSLAPATAGAFLVSLALTVSHHFRRESF